MELIELPGATLRMGSNADEVHSRVRYWGARLVDDAYNADEFQRWILKEFPKHPVKHGRERRRMAMDFYAPYPGGMFIRDDLSEVWGGRYRILRGGSFARGGDLARCARRHGPFPSPVFRYTGFRIAAAPAS
jgi:hypothetical protein